MHCCTPEPWFWKPQVQNQHLWGLLNCRAHPGSFLFNRPGEGLENLHFYQVLKAMLLLLVQAPDFENHCPRDPPGTHHKAD